MRWIVVLLTFAVLFSLLLAKTAAAQTNVENLTAFFNATGSSLIVSAPLAEQTSLKNLLPKTEITALLTGTIETDSIGGSLGGAAEPLDTIPTLIAIVAAALTVYAVIKWAQEP
jgi:hypothetical protein